MGNKVENRMNLNVTEIRRVPVRVAGEAGLPLHPESGERVDGEVKIRADGNEFG